MVRRWVIAATSGAAVLAALAIVVSAAASTAPAAPAKSPNPGLVPTPGLVDSMDSTLAPAWADGLTFTHATADLSSDEASSLTSMPWRFVALDGKVLRVVFVAGDGACVLPRGFSVSFTKTSLELWVLSTTDSGQAACPARLERGAADVTLAEPLNGRVLIHAPTDRQWLDSMLD